MHSSWSIYDKPVPASFPIAGQPKVRHAPHPVHDVTIYGLPFCRESSTQGLRKMMTSSRSAAAVASFSAVELGKI